MAANLNNLLDAGLFTYGTYDSTNSIMNITATNIQVAGVTAFSGTFSTVGAKVATVSKGLIIGIA